MTQDSFEERQWQIIEDGFRLEDAPTDEALFCLGNGYLGMRGSLEEGLPGHSIEGNYVNGFYESAPITYGEKFCGYAENRQTMLNLANAKVIQLRIGDEAFSLLEGEILEHRRVLDMREGVLRRSVRWQSPQGLQVHIESERLVLHQHRHVALIRYRVTPLNFSGAITLFSGIDGDVAQGQQVEEDPRLGVRFSKDVLQLQDKAFAGDAALLMQKTKTTQFTVACGIRNTLDAAQPHTVETRDDGRCLGFVYTVEAQQGAPITLDKIIVYATSRDTDTAQLVPAVLAELESAAVAGFEALRQEQRAYLERFWYRTDVIIQGDDELQRGIRFNLLHLLQSTGKDGRTNIAAKGLTGEGYEGHYFWDTETYVLPFFLYNNPEISRKLLEYRYHILDKARERAREMAHKQGALFPWRTIDGEECSPYYPAGTAQYHIDADIAFAIRRYYDATEDAEFMKRYGIEILCETARLWRDVGDFIPAKGDQFCINGVTGPDEYKSVINNNAYTNLMARENLRFAREMVAWLKETDADAYRALVAKIGLQKDEPAAWQEAADRMYVPYDEALGIIPQDDAFLSKAVWDFDNTPEDHYPLLLHYHPLVINRYQVCKQADLVLAEFLLHDQFDKAQKRRDYDYYEPLTTHDSSLSECIFGIMAAEVGYKEKSYRYFVHTATTDLENKKGNTKDGIHAANMAGAWQAIVFGFAGMRAKDGLLFDPMIPEQWQGYAFKITYRDRLVDVRITHDGAEFRLLEGAPMEIQVGGKPMRLA